MIVPNVQFFFIVQCYASLVRNHDKSFNNSALCLHMSCHIFIESTWICILIRWNFARKLNNKLKAYNSPNSTIETCPIWCWVKCDIKLFCTKQKKNKNWSEKISILNNHVWICKWRVTIVIISQTTRKYVKKIRTQNNKREKEKL